MSDFIEQYWILIEQHPVPFLTFGGLCAVFTATFVLWSLKERISAKDALIELLKTKLAEDQRKTTTKVMGDRG